MATRTNPSLAPCRLNNRCTSRTEPAVRRPSDSTKDSSVDSVNGLTESDFYMDDAGRRVGWLARASETSPSDAPWILVAHALCAAL